MRHLIINVSLLYIVTRKIIERSRLESKKKIWQLWLPDIVSVCQYITDDKQNWLEWFTPNLLTQHCFNERCSFYTPYGIPLHLRLNILHQLTIRFRSFPINFRLSFNQPSQLSLNPTLCISSPNWDFFLFFSFWEIMIYLYQNCWNPPAAHLIG